MFELIEQQIGDRRLHGLVTCGATDSPIAVHLHGTGGNFYANKIATAFAPVYREFGYRFATINLPGYDSEYRTENYADYGPALDSWLKRLSTGDYLLQGHSLGALKALDHLRNRDKSERCKRVVLLSPFDIVAFYCSGKPEKHEDIRRQVLVVQNELGDAASVPKAIFDVWDISAGTHLSMTEIGGVLDCFPSRNAELITAGQWLPRQDVFVAIGGADFAAFPSPSAVEAMMPNAKNLKYVLIEGAPHNFDGRIEILASALRDWLSKS